MAHAQKPDLVFRRNGRVHLNRRERHFSRLLRSRGVRISGSSAGYTTFRGSVRVLATHSIRQFPLHLPSRASPCAIRFQTHSTALVKTIQDYSSAVQPSYISPSGAISLLSPSSLVSLMELRNYYRRRYQRSGFRLFHDLHQLISRVLTSRLSQLRNSKWASSLGT